MKMACRVCLAAFVLTAVFVGCKEPSPEKPKAPAKTETVEPKSVDEKFKANFAKLDPADRKLAEAQVFCAVDNENPLGSMGVPFKVMVKDQAVFVCCKSCQKAALANPDKTLAKVEELRKKSADAGAK